MESHPLGGAIPSKSDLLQARSKLNSPDFKLLRGGAYVLLR